MRKKKIKPPFVDSINGYSVLKITMGGFVFLRLIKDEVKIFQSWVNGSGKSEQYVIEFKCVCKITGRKYKEICEFHRRDLWTDTLTILNQYL